MKRTILGVWMAAVAVLHGAAIAEELPNPATIDLPDVSVAGDPKAVEEGYKFFYFHNPSVTFEEAYRDIADCRAYLATGPMAGLPSFIPWTEPVATGERKKPQYFPNPYGLVGAAIGAIILPKMERGVRNNKLRLCMEPRGYDRYPVPEAAWEILNEGDEAQLILLQAKIASGPVPAAPKVTE